jgi:hypothetical protein
MYIHDEEWDDLNNICCDLVEKLEAMPEDIFFPGKNEAIGVCYAIINQVDVGPPIKQRNYYVSVFILLFKSIRNFFK